MSLDKLGPYQFKGVLGRGGMGTVYRGKHQETGEYHAVKVLAPNFADDDHFRARFESEIKALLKLNHPNIVQLVSYGQEDGLLFFAMELIEGNSLFQMQRKGHKFDWRQVLSIARDVCHGLRHAHDRGIIHRDLKPGNLLMTNRPDDDDQRRTIDGLVKITDFGIAKSFGSSQNTGTNVLGTMDFMSPEQAKGEPVTFRSDLYSLGTVLFTLLSGKPPFTSNSVEESLRNLTRVPPPYVSNMVPDVPPELDRLIRQLMAKRPKERVPTALALLHRIEEIEDHLRSHSEALTAERDYETLAGDTFDIASPAAAGLTELSTGKLAGKSTGRPRLSGNPTAEFTERDLDEIRSDSGSRRRTSDSGESGTTVRAHNYFNTVTDDVRKQHESFEEVETDHGIGKLPLVIALLVTVGLATFGVYRALKPPSADELYEKIIVYESRPEHVLDEINEFLTHFPDEQRSLKVMELEGVGRAVRLYDALTRKLAVRAGLPGPNRLTPIEQQFMEIVELADKDITMANSKMAAFVNLYSNDPDLSERDALCLEAARNYRVKIRADARSRVMSNITQIESAMEKAASTQDPADAARIYDSIVELYGNVMWGNESESSRGRALITLARKMHERKLNEVRRNLQRKELEGSDSGGGA